MAVLFVLAQPLARVGTASAQHPAVTGPVSEMRFDETRYDSGRPEDHLAPERRRRILVGPPVPRADSQGRISVEPNLSIADGRSDVGTWGVRNSDYPSDYGISESVSPLMSLWQPFQSLPPPEPMPDEQEFETLPYYFAPPTAEPVFGHLADDFHDWMPEHWVPDSLAGRDFRCGPVNQLLQSTHDAHHDIGIGHERVAFALFEIDQTQPMNQFRMRLDMAHNVEFPDRAEYYWARIGGPRNPNPTPERSMDYQDLRIMMELGGKRFSVQTEIPIRAIAPEVRGNTAGPGDMSVTTKTVFVDGRDWQITQIFRTYLPTGSPSRGTGTGNVAMEPGVLCRYKWSDITYIHSELKYWFPIGGDPFHSGQVFRYGVGVSHLLYETDQLAAIPTLEFVGFVIQDGRKTLPDPPPISVPVDGEHIFNVYPGLRIVADTNSDLGLWEFGLATGFALTSRHWYDAMLRIELRFVY